MDNDRYIELHEFRRVLERRMAQHAADPSQQPDFQGDMNLKLFPLP